MILSLQAGTEFASVEIGEDVGRQAFRSLARRMLALRQEDVLSVETSVSACAPDGEDCREESDKAEGAPETAAEDTADDTQGGAADTIPDQPRTVHHTDELKRYVGFLLVECRACGTRKAYNAKTPLAQHRCVCGEYTQLEPLAKATAICPDCGKKWRYQTNVCDADLDLNCIACGASMHLWWDAKKKKYRTIL